MKNKEVTYISMNTDVSVSCYTSENYIQTIFINANRTTSQSLEDSSYYMLATALTLDSSLTASAASSMLTPLLTNASSRPGQDYSTTRNGIKYTINVSQKQIICAFEKSN